MAQRNLMTSSKLVLNKYTKVHLKIRVRARPMIPCYKKNPKEGRFLLIQLLSVRQNVKYVVNVNVI